MTRCFPTLRGWIALILAAFAILYFPLVRPAILVSSRGTFLAESVTPAAWITGALLIIICFVTSAEAFRRGSLADKVVACISVLLTIGLLYGYLELFYLPVRHSPKPASGNAGIATQLTIGHHWPGVPEPERLAVDV